VLIVEEHDREIAQPDPQELMGWREIGQMLGVAYQRAQQLARIFRRPWPRWRRDRLHTPSTDGLASGGFRREVVIDAVARLVKP
jgi:hypothetical protein